MDTFTNTSLKEQISHDAFVASLTPKEIVAELEKFIVGQNKAKRAVAIALRNRWRSQQLPEDIRDEVAPKNILMIGPTGVGKTEIARRLAKLANSPFIKVEASKYTEVGYVGRDVESIIRDLMETAMKMLREDAITKVANQAADRAEDRILDVLLPPARGADGTADAKESGTRQVFRKKLREGLLDDKEIDIEVSSTPVGVEIMAPPGMEDMTNQLQGLFANMGKDKKQTRKLKISDALKQLQDEEPLIPGSKGGYGFAQWTGVRRDGFENWIKSYLIFVNNIVDDTGNISQHFILE